MRKKLQDAIKEHAKGIYFCDLDDDGVREIWEPFENWDLDDINDQIEVDVEWWTEFIEDNKDLILDYLKGV